jgi:hypothetical protein
MMLVVAGCGSDGGGLDCTSVSSCGGDITGQWQWQGTCVMTPPCPGTTIDTSKASEVATFSGGKYSVSYSGTEQVSYPLSCFGGDGGAMISCEQIGQGKGNTCVKNATTCDCTIDLAQAFVFPTLDYTTSNGTISVTVGGGPPSTINYCVTGDTLRLGGTLPSNGSPAASEWKRL